MAKYQVEYEHDCTITYMALVDADSPEQAMDKVRDFDFISEEQIEIQGQYVRPQYAILVEE